MGSHKKPLCVGKCTSEDLDFIFFFLGWGEGGGGRRYVPSRLDSKSVFVKYLLSIALPMTHGSCLNQTLKNNIETELSVNYQKKKKKKSQVYKQCHFKKVFYSTGVCKLLF